MEIIATYRNTDDGIEAIIMDGNDKFNYRVVVREMVCAGHWPDYENRKPTCG
jgi:hypothetical protein